MYDTTVAVAIITALGSGTFVAIINGILNRRKTSADVASSNISDALRLKEAAMEQFKSTSEKLDEAQRLLEEVRQENDRLHRYIQYLEDILDNNSIQYNKIDIHRI